ncbi:Calcium-binding EF-hand family protein isoform 1 [Hibiscus syriacus]|uniref:Calcium-binding EF-hand family protein isoform 1 n=1 Tax=Hibiscus syriacus TaxID=106335 RepID=A0A6A2WCW5_HIBSY|nr:Calcium-binding EF-hand family protein isoform 1 [Hibiscus syriacus]
MASLANVLLSRRVQEMVLNGEEPESLYICRDEKEAANVPSPLPPIPVIDLNLLSYSPLTSKAEEELQKLKSALCSWGCFQAINHGIPSCFLDEFRQVTREFFQQPMEEKQKYSKGVEEVEGYGGDPTPEEGQFLDWQDRLEDLENYTCKMRMVTEIVSKSMAKSLGLEENCLVDEFGERAALQARLNYYPCCPRPEIVLGLKPHADGTGYTIILQDEVEGLQILQNQHWFTVPTLPDALLILMGDQMEIMTIFKSPVHRVVNHMEKERTSIAVFYTPQKHKEIGPLDGLVNEGTPPLFNKDETIELHGGTRNVRRGVELKQATPLAITLATGERLYSTAKSKNLKRGKHDFRVIAMGESDMVLDGQRIILKTGQPSATV